MKKFIIMFSGNIGSGKTYSANYLYNKFPNDSIILSFATPIKNLFSSVFINKDGILEKNYAEKPILELYKLYYFFKEKINENFFEYEKYIKNSLEKNLINHFMYYFLEKDQERRKQLARRLFQMFGTDIVRNKVDKNFFVKEMIKKIETSDKNIFLIDDLRFENEALLIKKYFENKNYSVKIICINCNEDNRNLKEISSHESEKQIKKIRKIADYNFENNKTNLYEINLNQIENFLLS